MNNLIDCAMVKEMTPVEAAQTLKMLSEKIRGPVGLGVWEGTLHGEISGQVHGNRHVAVFRETDLIAPFGPQDDEESEACAALFAVALANAEKIATAMLINPVELIA
jgi:hypothetical protein